MITWQNANRKKFDQYANNQVVTISFKAPASTTQDPKEAMIARLAAMTPEEREQELRDMMAQAQK